MRNKLIFLGGCTFSAAVAIVVATVLSDKAADDDLKAMVRIHKAHEDLLSRRVAAQVDATEYWRNEYNKITAS